MSKRNTKPTTPTNPLATALGETAEEKIARLEAELASVKEAKRTTLKLRVSEKGAVSLYGIRRFPVTFYADEWDRILGVSDRIEAFIGENRAALKVKAG